MEKELERSLHQSKLIHSPGYKFLVPILRKGITIGDAGKTGSCLLTSEGGKIIGAIPDEARAIILNCDGRKNILNISQDMPNDSKAIENFLYELWCEKIIYFETQGINQSN